MNSQEVWVTNDQHASYNNSRDETREFIWVYSGTMTQIYPGSFDGQLDDIGIWNRELDITEIGNLYGGSCQVYDTITVLDTIPYSVTDTLFIDVQLTSTNPLEFQNTIKGISKPNE